MPRYDLAGNPLPETGPSSPPPETLPTPAPRAPMPPLPAASRPAASRPVPAPPKPLVYAPAPVAAPAAPPAPHAILTRGVTQETPAQKVRAYAGLLATFVGLVIATYAVAAIPSPRTPVPNSYAPYTDTDDGFACDAPTGWRQLTDKDDDQIAFKDKQAMILMTGGPVPGGGSPADAGNAGNAPTGDAGAAGGPSVDDLHAQDKAMLDDALGDTPDQEQAAQVLATPMGPLRLSEWTATAQLTRLHGYRATVVGGGEVVTLVCLCPQRDWNALKPAFLHVIQSITPAAAPATPDQTGGQ